MPMAPWFLFRFRGAKRKAVGTTPLAAYGLWIVSSARYLIRAPTRLPQAAGQR